MGIDNNFRHAFVFTSVLIAVNIADKQISVVCAAELLFLAIYLTVALYPIVVFFLLSPCEATRYV